MLNPLTFNSIFNKKNFIETTKGPVFGTEGVVSFPAKAFSTAEKNAELNEIGGEFCIARVFD